MWDSVGTALQELAHQDMQETRVNHGQGSFQPLPHSAPNEQCVKAARIVPHMSKEQTVALVPEHLKLWDVVGISAMMAAFVLVWVLTKEKLPQEHVVPNMLLHPWSSYVFATFSSHRALPRSDVCVHLPICAKPNPQFCGWRQPCLPPFPNKACKCLAEGGLVAYLNMLSEPLSNQSVKFAVQVCSPDLLFNSLENLS